MDCLDKKNLDLLFQHHPNIFVAGEGNIPSHVVFEILSPNNTQREMDQKLLFYDRYGVEEYYLYDLDTNQLRGWL